MYVDVGLRAALPSLSSWPYTLMIFVQLCKIALGTTEHSYCQYETFEAGCGDNEVIIMRIARYGRMQIGRCVNADFGFLGCYSDVTKLMDRQCSGRQRCQVRVVDPTFGNIQPCNKEFKNYLEASYDCLQVLPPDEYLCTSHPTRALPSQGYISSVLTTRCGTEERPYVIRTPPGQSLNLSLIDFNLESLTDNHMTSVDSGCNVYATVREPFSGRSVQICGGQKKDTEVFRSSSNIVELILSQASEDDPPSFLLKYQVDGCPPLAAPAHAWVEQDGSRALIRCNSSQQAWRLYCKGTNWIGHLGNCTTGEHSTSSEVVSDAISLPTGVLIAIVIGIACIISFSILLLGVYYLRRHRRRNARNGRTKTVAMSAGDEYSLHPGASTYAQRECTLLSHRQSCPICTRQRDVTGDLNQCEYGYTWGDNGTLAGRRGKAEKIYSAGIYGPLPCRCIPIKMKELTDRRMTIPGDIEPTYGRMPSAASIDRDPDVVRQDSSPMRADDPTRGGTSSFQPLSTCGNLDEESIYTS